MDASIDQNLTLQLILVATLTFVCIAVLLRHQRGPSYMALGLVIVVSASGGAWLAWSETSRAIASREQLEREVPYRVAASPDPEAPEYVSSDRCRACHPAQYASWHDTYHRSMTQLAGPDTILGPFDGRRLEARGRRYRLERRGEEYWVEMADPDWERGRLEAGLRPEEVANPPMAWKRVVMTTGSHHMQTYWVASRHDGRLFNFPWLWLVEDQRFIPREDGFIRPPDGPRTFDIWHGACIECHAVAGEKVRGPGGTWLPQVAELGIACEACHGPAEEHVSANHDPMRRLRLQVGGEGDPTIVNPSRLDAEESSQVCGQCHGMNLFKGYVRKTGERFQPGGDLRRTRIIMRATERARLEESTHPDPQRVIDQAHLETIFARQLKGTDSFLRDRYWPDGMVRVSGREHNSFIESACFDGGQLSCLSCHSMHESDPDDQLAAPPSGPPDSHPDDRNCLGCHPTYATDLEAHTHHASDSPGSRCYNCHMPHTVYGLMKSIRSHWIDSPNATTTQRSGRPDACSLCHLDRTLAWTANQLETRYGQPMPDLSSDERELAGVVRWGVQGNAQHRSMVAWHLGWKDAGAAVEPSDDWRPFFLAHLLGDPYSAVRHVAGKSLSALRPDLLDDYDFLASDAAHERTRTAAMERAAPIRGRAAPLRELVRDADGALDSDRFVRLSALRDDQEMDLRE